MSRRIPHRPRYHKVHATVPPLSRSGQELFHTRWTYRRRELLVERHPLGYRLSFIPFGYRLMKQMFLPPKTAKSI